VLILLIQILHGIAAIIWVGGIFFAYMALRPAANITLEPKQRLTLWQSTFSHFFPWVWVMIIILLTTGYIDLFNRFDGFKHGLLYLELMHGMGLLMIALFVYLYFGLYRILSKYVKEENTSAAALIMNKMRPIIAINLILGLSTSAIGIVKFS